MRAFAALHPPPSNRMSAGRKHDVWLRCDYNT